MTHVLTESSACELTPAANLAPKADEVQTQFVANNNPFRIRLLLLTNDLPASLIEVPLPWQGSVGKLYP